jgi:hypothetical protein
MLSQLQQHWRRFSDTYFAPPPRAGGAPARVSAAHAATGSAAAPDAAAAGAAMQLPRTTSKAARVRSIQHAMSKERAIREAQEPFDFMSSVRRYNWKALVLFMVAWSVLGYYVVPWVKGFKGLKPPSQEERDAQYNASKQKFVAESAKVRQRVDMRRQRAERLDALEAAAVAAERDERRH